MKAGELTRGTAQAPSQLNVSTIIFFLHLSTVTECVCIKVFHGAHVEAKG